MVVCLCKRATDRDIADAIDDGARSVDEVGEACGAGTGCGCCRGYIHDQIHDQLALTGAPCGGGCIDCPSQRMSLAG